MSIKWLKCNKIINFIPIYKANTKIVLYCNEKHEHGTLKKKAIFFLN